MNMYNSLSPASTIICSQLAQKLFELLDEQPMVMIIKDIEGTRWCSNAEELAKLDISEDFINDTCRKIDDGEEPLLTHKDDISIMAFQLATKRTNCGYVFIVLPKSDPENTLRNICLVDLLRGQVELIAELVEKNLLLYEMQMRLVDAAGKQNCACLN